MHVELEESHNRRPLLPTPMSNSDRFQIISTNFRRRMSRSVSGDLAKNGRMRWKLNAQPLFLYQLLESIIAARLP